VKEKEREWDLNDKGEGGLRSVSDGFARAIIKVNDELR